MAKSINADLSNFGMTYSLGIMQGRLTPSNGRGIQFFPFDNWENEFKLAAQIGLNEIEFIFDLDRFTENPLWSENGLATINQLINETGVKVNHICADYFMRRPFFRTDDATRQENIDILKKLIVVAKQIGAQTVEIPLVDNSSIKTEDEQNTLIAALNQVIPTAVEQGVTLTLETDLPPKLFLELLQRINNPLVKANYDSGNSSGLGYDPYEEITTLGKLVHNIHIKDRLLGGTTRPLGMGSANFDKLFQAIKEVGYRGSFILQVARQTDGDEPRTIKQYINFVNGYIQKYLA